jgi:hypothetical protein
MEKKTFENGRPSSSVLPTITAIKRGSAETSTKNCVW